MAINNRIRVGITIGDPSGIGPAITLKAVAKLKDKADFVIIGDRWVLGQVLGSRCQVLGDRFQSLEFVDLKNVNRKSFKFGKIRAEYGRASVEYLDKSLEMIRDKKIDCLVTCPVSKEAINKAGISFVGHTEYLAQKTNTKVFVMMLLNKDLKFSLITRHLPLKEVSRQINKDTVYSNIYLTYKCLKKNFGIRNPRIVVCGLNPHASDNGVIGNEENTIIKPAIAKLNSRFKMCIDGPISADVAVKKCRQGVFDVVIAMYHDQALIPLKLSSSFKSANLTLGLPFIRTSPLHGTAFDIAGSFSEPNPLSLIEAIKLAVKCTLNQKKG